MILSGEISRCITLELCAASSAEETQIAEKLSKIKIEIKVKAGENGKIFGGISSKEIAEKLEKDYKIKVDKKKIELKETIKTLGITKIQIKLAKM